ncbi:rCG25937, isoform CRA_d [Rattus norvegicus]|uniref:RCG25937, isoform CRA_d n=1 Tax=Rattus norvegicus TaxID=10116 RepID=A6I1B2_RAT|nr:rCG25937, isoform CRA_d [Rattus norvegicus]
MAGPLAGGPAGARQAWSPPPTSPPAAGEGPGELKLNDSLPFHGVAPEYTRELGLGPMLGTQVL